MANLYDEQFKNRLRMHMLVCDQLSAELIRQLMYFVENPPVTPSYTHYVDSDPRVTCNAIRKASGEEG